jgi:hypothetical protein
MEEVDLPLYKLWPGSNRFLVKGAIRLGPWVDCGYNMCLWLTILAPTIFFFVIPAPIVWLDVSPAIVAVVCGLVILSIALFVKASCDDPGYIPRKEIQILLNIQKDVRRILGVPNPENDVAEMVYLQSDGVSRTLQIENWFNDESLLTEEMRARGYKYCSTCRIIRPPRASHCADCDSCCLRHDHHCPFINNCVGHRNYLIFLCFVVSAIVLGMMILFAIILWIADGNSSFSSPIVVTVVGCVVGIPVGIMLLFGVAFSMYHTFLACSGKTTREHLRGRLFDAVQPEGTTAHPSVLSSSFFSRPPQLYPSLTTRVRVQVKHLIPTQVSLTV